MNNKNMILYGSFGAVVLIVIIIAVFMLVKKEGFSWSSGVSPNLSVPSVTGATYSTVTGGAANFVQGGSLMLESDANGNLSTSATLPIGAIVIWYGPQSSIPVGWILCDGNNGTPNLSANIFPLGVNSDTSIGQTGGSQNVTLGLSNIPSHQHKIYAYLDGSAHKTNSGNSNILGSQGMGNIVSLPPSNTADVLSSSWSGGNGSDIDPGSTQAFSIMNPYIGVYYIMKIQ